MKSETFFLILGTICLAGACYSSAQDTSKAEEAGRAALDDPRFKNMLRSIEKDSDGSLSSISDDPEASVRNATELFLKNKDKLKVDDDTISPEMKSDLERKAKGAVSAISQMIDKEKSSPGEVPATREAVIPATRSATVTAVPIAAVPVSPEDAPAVQPEPSPETVVQRNTVRPEPGASAIPSQIPDSADLTPEQIPEPKPLEKKYDMTSKGSLRPKKNKQSAMEIFAKESVMDNESNLLIFTGNVVVNHPQYDMKCERLEITMAGGNMMPTGGESGGASFSRAVASGGTVEIRSVGPEGQTRLALARRADYDAVSEIITLTGGPPYLQDGDRFIETKANDAEIIMRINGRCEIKGSDRSHIVIPVEKPKKGEGMGIDSALGNLSDRGKPERNRR